MRRVLREDQRAQLYERELIALLLPVLAGGDDTRLQRQSEDGRRKRRPACQLQRLVPKITSCRG